MPTGNTEQKMKKYEEIYRKLREDLTEGSITYGQKLPSKRTAAELFGASVITIEHSYGLLESEGYIRAKNKSGFYSCYRPGNLIAEKEYSPLSVQQNHTQNHTQKKETFPFSVYASAVRAVLSDYGDAITEKTDGSGAKELKHAIKNYLKTSRNISSNENDIVVGAGAEYLYGIIARLIGTDKVFAVETPSYGQIEQVYAANGENIEKLRLGPDGILTEDLNRSDADVLHVTPYRSFPSGITASASKRAEYLAWARANDAYIVEDDYKSEFSLSANLTETLFGLSADNNVIYVNTFSETVFPSLRLAYMILPGSLMKIYNEKFGSYSCTVPALEQFVVTKLLTEGSFARHINRVRRLLKTEKPIR